MPFSRSPIHASYVNSKHELIATYEDTAQLSTGTLSQLNATIQLVQFLKYTLLLHP